MGEREQREREKELRSKRERGRYDSVRLTPEHLGLPPNLNASDGFKHSPPGVYNAIRAAERGWEACKKDGYNPLADSKLYYVAITLYTNKHQTSDTFYSVLNASLSGRNPKYPKNTFTRYSQILNQTLLHLTEKEHKDCPATLYRGIGLPQGVYDDMKADSFRSLEANNQYGSFSENKDVAARFATMRRGNQPVIMELKTNPNIRMALIGRYFGFNGEEEWMRLPGDDFKIPQDYRDTRLL